MVRRNKRIKVSTSPSVDTPPSVGAPSSVGTPTSAREQQTQRWRSYFDAFLCDHLVPADGKKLTMGALAERYSDIYKQYSIQCVREGKEPAPEVPPTKSGNADRRKEAGIHGKTMGEWINMVDNVEPYVYNRKTTTLPNGTIKRQGDIIGYTLREL